MELKRHKPDAPQLVQPLSRVPSQRSGFGRINHLLTPEVNLVVQFEKGILEWIVYERPGAIMGDIWLGIPPGLLPSISMRLERSLDAIIKSSGKEINIAPFSPHANIVNDAPFYRIKVEALKQVIHRNGFGDIFWNETGEEGFITMQIADQELTADISREGVLVVHKIL